MQLKPSQPTHKLLCWQSRGEEDITLCGIDTQKNEQRGGGIFKDIFGGKARKPELEGKLPEGRKGGGKPQAAVGQYRAELRPHRSALELVSLEERCRALHAG